MQVVYAAAFIGLQFTKNYINQMYQYVFYDYYLVYVLAIV